MGSTLEAQSFAGYFEWEHAASGLRYGVGNGIFGAFFHHEQHAATATGATNLGRAATVFAGNLDKFVDARSGNAGRIRAPQFPFFA
jgi:hypothetical protein